MHLKRLTLILMIMFYSLPAFGEIIKPNNGIEPIQVVKIEIRIFFLGPPLISLPRPSQKLSLMPDVLTFSARFVYTLLRA